MHPMHIHPNVETERNKYVQRICGTERLYRDDISFVPFDDPNAITVAYVDSCDRIRDNSTGRIIGRLPYQLRLRRGF